MEYKATLFNVEDLNEQLPKMSKQGWIINKAFQPEGKHVKFILIIWERKKNAL